MILPFGSTGGPPDFVEIKQAVIIRSNVYFIGPFDMDSAVLRVIFDHRIEKLTFSSGIPEALEELNVAVKQMLAITNDIRASSIWT
ncbi:hypothetical protein SRHO_G00290060 [Serrasalmus rhombeus]